MISHKELFLARPGLGELPLDLRPWPRGGLVLQEDIETLRSHLDPGNGTLFADAACGSPSFDVSFRRFVTALLPDHPLVDNSPRRRALLPRRRRLRPGRRRPVQQGRRRRGQATSQLEGIKLSGHWAVIYSKYDIGCCPGAATRASDLQGAIAPRAPLRIATNIVILFDAPP